MGLKGNLVKIKNCPRNCKRVLDAFQHLVTASCYFFKPLLVPNLFWYLLLEKPKGFVFQMLNQVQHEWEG